MKKAIRVKRLEQLLEMMQNHHKLFPNVKFNINLWGSSLDYKNNRAEAPKQDCGSAACALGSACLYKPFTKFGLKIPKSGWDPEYLTYSGYEAGAKFFGLTNAESIWLFNPHSYRQANNDSYHDVTRAMVIKRIKKLLEHYKLMPANMQIVLIPETDHLPFDYYRFGVPK